MSDTGMCLTRSAAVPYPRHPHYWPVDSLHLLHRLEGMFYVRLSNKSLLPWLRGLLGDCVGYEKYLRQYPAVLCAPLDLHYVFRRAACTLDEELLQDLLFSWSWREANWGAWLAAIAPQAQYVDHLQRRRPSLPHGTVVADLALAACAEAPGSPELAEHWTLLGQLRSQLEQLPELRSPLRLTPPLLNTPQSQRGVDAVRAAYRRGGVTAAREIFASEPLWGPYFSDHLAWARDQAEAGKVSSIP